MKFVRVQDGVVMELFAELPEFHPDIMATIHEAPDEVEARWTFDGTTYAAPVPIEPTAEEITEAKRAEAWDRVQRRLIDEELAKEI